MRNLFLLIFTISVLLVFTGCTVVEEKEAMADYRPDRYWENVWKIEERASHLTVNPDSLILEASSLVKYLGEKPVEDVKIIMRSPLTYNFIDDSLVRNFGSINPGEVMTYNLYLECPQWQQNVPVGVFTEKLINDFVVNSYVGIGWRDDNNEYNIHFYDWGHGSH